MAAALPQGFDFRSTLAYVTDPANCTFVAPTTAYSSGTGYGWEQPPSAAQNNSTTIDPRLAGINYRSNTAAAVNFRVDLPAAGTYSISLAVGCATLSQAHYVAIYDGTTLLATILSGQSTPIGSFYDATATLYTAAAWPGSNTPISLTFATTTLRVQIGGGPTGITCLSHVFVQSAGGSPVSLTTSAGAVTATGYAPTVAVGATLAPSAGSVALTGFAPTLAVGTTLATNAGAITVAGHPPAITVAGGSTSLAPDAGLISLLGFPPTITARGLIVLDTHDGGREEGERRRRLEDREERRRLIEEAAGLRAIARGVPDPQVREAAKEVRAAASVAQRAPLARLDLAPLIGAVDALQAALARYAEDEADVEMLLLS